MAEGLRWFMFECDMPDFIKWLIVAGACFAIPLTARYIGLKIARKYF